VLARNIRAVLQGRAAEPFHFDSLGALCVVGHHTACAELTVPFARGKSIRFRGLVRLAAVARHLSGKIARPGAQDSSAERLGDRAVLPSRHRPNHRAETTAIEMSTTSILAPPMSAIASDPKPLALLCWSARQPGCWAAWRSCRLRTQPMVTGPVLGCALWRVVRASVCESRLQRGFGAAVGPRLRAAVVAGGGHGDPATCGRRSYIPRSVEN
jgi:hypothetical protein